MPGYYIWTIGCQMNRYESERLECALAAIGYAPAPSAAAADVIILNTCVVRQSAEARVINQLQNLKALKQRRPEVILAVTGCFVDGDSAAFRQRFPFVDSVFAAGEIPEWLSSQAQRLPEKASVSSYLTIMQGCNNFCSYCIVPYRRGRERSRQPADIKHEAAELVRRGAREIVLLGQNVDSYGRDLGAEINLAGLLEELNQINGLKRLRFLTNHPKDMTPVLIEAMSALDKVCESVNLPIQAGDDQILEAMGRGYGVAHYRELLHRLRRQVPNLAVTTDIIVGFPGESERQFLNTLELAAELRFDNIHTAAYSPRAGTRAAAWPDDVPAEVKAQRLARLEQQQEHIQTEINASLAGHTMEVLVERRQRGKWQGRTRSDKLVFFQSGENLRSWLVRVKIDKTSPWWLQGTLVDYEEA
jgi:tRNA-2-methylthio-N6-dimethylallyladenosine synthase